MWWDPKVGYISILTRIPSKIGIIPVLSGTHRKDN